MPGMRNLRTQSRPNHLILERIDEFGHMYGNSASPHYDSSRLKRISSPAKVRFRYDTTRAI